MEQNMSNALIKWMKNDKYVKSVNEIWEIREINEWNTRNARSRVVIKYEKYVK